MKPCVNGSALDSPKIKNRIRNKFIRAALNSLEKLYETKEAANKEFSVNFIFNYEALFDSYIEIFFDKAKKNDHLLFLGVKLDNLSIEILKKDSIKFSKLFNTILPPNFKAHKFIFKFQDDNGSDHFQSHWIVGEIKL